MKDKTIPKTLRLVLVIALYIGAMTIPNVLAANYAVTVKWIIPGDYSISIAYPAQVVEGKIIFDATATGMNFTELGASGQSDGTAAFNITNTGNCAIDISANWSSGLYTNVTLVNISSVWAVHTQYSWSSANASDAPIEISDNLAVGGVVGYYAWSSGVRVPETTGSEKPFNLTTAAHT